MNWTEIGWLSRLIHQLTELQPRELLLLRLTLVVCILLALGLIFVEPLWREAAQQAKEVRTLELNRLNTSESLRLLKQHEVEDPNKQLQQKLQQLQQQTRLLEQQTRQLSDDILQPREMVQLLRQVLGQTEGLKLVALENLAAEPVQPVGVTVSAAVGGATGAASQASRDAGSSSGPAAEADEQVNQPLFWKHRFRIRMKATWAGSVNYLQALENSDYRLFWQSLDYQLDDHPWGTLELEVFTLSTRKEVLGG